MKPLHNPLREKSFFRKTSNVMIKRFFEHHAVLADLDWEDRKEEDMAEVYDAYRRLPDDAQKKVEEDLENINDLATQRGMPCLVNAASECGVDCKDMTAHDLAMVLFLDKRDAFDAAHDWWTIDHFQGYTDFRGLRPIGISNPDAGRPKFEAAFSKFMGTFEKGIDIHVDVYKDTKKVAYVVCHEDYVKPIERFREHKLIVEKDRPVFYATMVYYPSRGKLKVKAAKNELVDFSRDAFAEHVLGEKGFFEHKDVKLIYDLDRFKRPWRFELDAADRIEWVHVVGIRFQPDPKSKDTVEVRSYTNLEQRLKDMNVDLNKAVIKSVSICFKFPGKGRSGPRTVNLSMPNGNNLGDSKNDQLIEGYLVEWKIANI